MEYLDKFQNEMNLSGHNVFTGNRYVPKLYGEWDNSKPYESLTIVQYKGNSFTSRQPVPSGIDINNEEYWVSTGNYNAQIEQYRKDVRNLEKEVNDEITGINDEINGINVKIEKITHVIENIEQLKLLSNSTGIKHLTIGEEITIPENLTLNENIILNFTNGGNFTIPSGVTLTLNAQIEAGRYQIFKFEDETSILTTDKVKFGTELNSTKVQYEIYPEWFGAAADAYPSENYLYQDESFVFGTNSTLGFKKALEFAEKASAVSWIEPNRNTHPSVTLSLIPNGVYYLVGDNPLGVQSNIANTGYSVHIKGNGSTILWKPLSVSDSLFAKYGRMVKPKLRDFNVILIGKKGNRWGRFVSTKTNQGDDFHVWNGGSFKNLRLGNHTNIGFDKVFDIGKDGASSHDDLTILEHVSAITYNTFLNIENIEAVNWYIIKTTFISNTPDAIHVNIPNGFSGGLTIESCELLLREVNETFIKTGSNVSSTPIKFINGRMETRNSNKMTLIDAVSGEFEVNNIRIQSGNGNAIPHIDTRMVKLGLAATAKFDTCTLYDKFDVEHGNGQRNKSLIFDNVTFIGTASDTSTVLRSFGYPQINYKFNGTVGNLADLIKSGNTQRKITIKNVPISDGGLLLPINYGSRRANESENKAELFSVSSNGKPIASMQSFNSLPSNIVITSIKFWGKDIDTTLVDTLNITFYREGEPSTNNATIYLNFENGKTYLGEELLDNSIVYLPDRTYIVVSPNKGETLVSNESNIPASWIEINYKGVSKSIDSGIDTSKIIVRNIF